MPNNPTDPILVYRSDLLALISAVNNEEERQRLESASTGPSVGAEWRVIGTDGESDYASSKEQADSICADNDVAYPENAPHRVEFRTHWTTG